MQKLYFITGISGSGKTTVGRKLMEIGEVVLDSKIQKGLFHFVDTNGKVTDVQYPRDPVWRSKHKWVLNKQMFDEIVTKHADVGRIYLCGGADDLERYWHLGEAVFLLRIDQQTLIKRLNSPDRDNEFGKDEHTQKVLAERLERVQKRRVNQGAIPIDAVKSVDEVAKSILELSV